VRRPRPWASRISANLKTASRDGSEI
jgi:hypothetical protein